MLASLEASPATAAAITARSKAFRAHVIDSNSALNYSLAVEQTNAALVEAGEWEALSASA